MTVFGIDPGSERTGYACVHTDGRRHTLVASGAIGVPPRAAFPQRLHAIHLALVRLLTKHRPDCVALEDVFHAANARSALKLGHARGVAMLAAVQAGVPVIEYSPAAIKKAVVGHGRADKRQVQQMVRVLLRLEQVPSPHDAADAVAIAICHLHHVESGAARQRLSPLANRPSSWRHVRAADLGL
ncbi:MAG TPA: crossover junction endodeoxyribonuclease RuvC [Vicinamibacterales bacterium]|nr:crossover junction endodeoxyribonuclease RuvC [Vicinamibacterales bacterium]